MPDIRENPWNEFSPEGLENGEYHAKVDTPDQIKFLKRKSSDKEEFQLKLDLLPEPCIGDPTKAAFVFLATNPGFSDGNKSDGLASDKEAFEDPVIKEIVLHNLRNEGHREMYWADPRCYTALCADGERRITSPYYWYFGKADPDLEKTFPNTAGGTGTFAFLHHVLSYKGPLSELETVCGDALKQGKDPLKEVPNAIEKERENDPAIWSAERGFDLIRNHVAVVDCFPYHSKRADKVLGDEKCDLGSREYTIDLVNAAINNVVENGTFMMISRNMRTWNRLVKDLFDSERNGGRVFTSSTGSNVKVTPCNLRNLSGRTEGRSERDFRENQANTRLFWDVAERILRESGSVTSS